MKLNTARLCRQCACRCDLALWPLHVQTLFSAGLNPMACLVWSRNELLDTCSLVSLTESTGQGGLLFGLPVVLDTDSEDINVGDKVLLTYQGAELATVEIDAK